MLDVDWGFRVLGALAALPLCFGQLTPSSVVLAGGCEVWRCVYQRALSRAPR